MEDAPPPSPTPVRPAASVFSPALRREVPRHRDARRALPLALRAAGKTVLWKSSTGAPYGVTLRHAPARRRTPREPSHDGAKTLDQAPVWPAGAPVEPRSTSVGSSVSWMRRRPGPLFDSAADSRSAIRPSSNSAALRPMS